MRDDAKISSPLSLSPVSLLTPETSTTLEGAETLLGNIRKAKPAASKKLNSAEPERIDGDRRGVEGRTGRRWGGSGLALVAFVAPPAH